MQQIAAIRKSHEIALECQKAGKDTEKRIRHCHWGFWRKQNLVWQTLEQGDRTKCRRSVATLAAAFPFLSSTMTRVSRAQLFTNAFFIFTSHQMVQQKFKTFL